MKLYAPFAYGFASRFKTNLDKISFVIIFFLPILFSCMLIQAPFLWLIVRFIIAFCAQYCLYEIGYIQNDAFTTKLENAPNFRLDPKLVQFTFDNATGLIMARIVYFLALILLLINFKGINIMQFLVALFCMYTAFTMHNLIRNKANIVTYFILCSFKYCALPTLFLHTYLLPYAIFALMFSFVILRTIEHASKKKYNITFLKNIDIDAFRVKYYAALCAIAFILYKLDQGFLLLLLLSIWFLTYRVCALVFIKVRRIAR